MADERAGGASGPRGPSSVHNRRRRWSRFGRQGGQGPRAARAPDGPFYAALDLGTNNCRLLVAYPTSDSFHVVDAFSRIIRLGEGLGRSGRLSEAAMDRAIDALKICARKLAYRKNVRTRMIATEAARSALNGAEFLARAREEAGLSLEIVDRETEARLAAHGCAPLLDPDADGQIRRAPDQIHRRKRPALCCEQALPATWRAALRLDQRR